MKQEFSNKWNSSKQPRKQRKFRANAPLNIKKKMISVQLNKELKEKYKRRSFPVRKGDNVKVMIGEFKSKKGKILTVDYKNLKVTIDGLQRSKKEGTKVNVKFDPSNLRIESLVLDDKKRTKALERNIGEKNVQINK